MADWMDSISRGFAAGNEIGDTLAARGLRKRTADAERQLLEGQLTPEQYEQAIRDAQGRGFARFRDTETVAEGLRTRPLDVLNRRDDRAIAQSIVDGRFVDAQQLAGNRAGRTGDVAAGLKAREFGNALDEAGRVTTIGGRTNYAPALARREQNLLAMGDTSGAMAAQQGGVAALDQVLAPLANEALGLLATGDSQAAGALIQNIAEARGFKLQVGVDPQSGKLGAVKANGERVLFDDDQLYTLLNQLGAGNSTMLEDAVTQSAAEAKAMQERNAEIDKLAFQTQLKLFEQFKLPESQAGALASARTRMGAAGAKQVTVAPDGTVVMDVGGRIIHAVPVQEGEDPDAETVNGFRYTTPEGNPVSLSQIDDDVEAATPQFAQAAMAASQVLDQAQVQQAFEVLNTSLAGVSDLAWAQMGRTGASPMGQAFRRANSRIGDAETQNAVTTFKDIVLNNPRLEGTGDNPSSSAAGRYQFIDSTLREHILRALPDSQEAQTLRTLPRGSAEEKQFLNAIKTTGSEETNAVLDAAFDSFTASNARRLAQARIQPTPATLYAAHHFGAEGAIKFLSASPDTPIEEVFKPVRDRRSGQMVTNPVLTSNEYLLNGKTVGGAMQNWADRAPELFADVGVDTLLASNAPAEKPATAPAQNPEAVDPLQALREERKKLVALIEEVDPTPVRMPSFGEGAASRFADSFSQRPPNPEVAPLRQLLADMDRDIAAAEKESAASAAATQRAERSQRIADALQRGQGMLRRPPNAGAP